MLRRPLMVILCFFTAVAGIELAYRYLSFEYSYVAEPERTVRPPAALQALEADPDAFAAGSNPELLRTGREAFYSETYGNEVFFTDIMGSFDGALTLPAVFEACLRLRGQGTGNLQVRAAKTVRIGGRTIQKGELLDTGLDVAKGAYTPLGVTVKWSEGRLRAGVGCIACHAIADTGSGRVIEGVPNPDINIGLLLALGTNSAAFFTHTDVHRLEDFVRDGKRAVPTENGGSAALPDPDRLEEVVDEQFLSWPKGYVDTMVDTRNAPVQIPDSFTRGDHPYSWSGSVSAGPFHGLAFLSGIPNAQNMDPLSQVGLSRTLFGLDPEVYMGTILQRAAYARYRYHPESGERPSEFFAKVDPTPGAPGVNELVPIPEYPRASPVSISGLLASRPGYPVGYHLLALAAYQNTLAPPGAREPAPAASVLREGREVFRRAGCVSCHAGTYLTNNTIIPVSVIGTEPSRAQALRSLEPMWVKTPRMYAWDTPVPLPAKPVTHPLVMSGLAPEQLRLTLPHGGSEGGYKVPSLFGLSWSPPYLHDGGVAVGGDPAVQLGIPGTLYRGIPADAANSLRALVDRSLRSRVVSANMDHPDTVQAHIRGSGHAYWVDEPSGFTREQQQALIQYLLHLNDGAELQEPQEQQGGTR